MVRFFTVSTEVDHRVADHGCPACPETYPELCPCGGLMHAAAAEPDLEGHATLLTACDMCGRSEDQLDEI